LRLVCRQQTACRATIFEPSDTGAREDHFLTESELDIDSGKIASDTNSTATTALTGAQMKRVCLVLLLSMCSIGRADWNQFSFAGRDNVHSTTTYAPEFADASSRTYAPSYSPTATYAPAFTYAPIIATEPVPPAPPARLAQSRYSKQQIADIHARFAELEWREHVEFIAKLLRVAPAEVAAFIPQDIGGKAAPLPALAGNQAPVELHVQD
jgi:hypothetical protein